MSDVTEDDIRERLSGEGMVARLRDWTDGDTLWGVITLNPDTGFTSGKTFREGGEHGRDAGDMAREYYAGGGLTPVGVTALYRATVRDPRTEPRDPMDPGEPPLKFATLADVTVVKWKQSGDGDE